MAYAERPAEDFTALVQRQEARLYRTALAIVGNAHDAEDVVQEVFLRAYEKAPTFESVQHEAAWMTRVTVNLCRSQLRSPWHRREPLLDTHPAPEHEQQTVMEYVLALPANYRMVIHLFYYEGYSTGEIAALTGQREGTVRSLLSRARKKLSAAFKEDADEIL